MHNLTRPSLPLGFLLLLSLTNSSLSSFINHKLNTQSIQTRTLSDQVITTCQHPNTFAITYDDGPYDFQNNISDHLSSHNVHGTFFVNGNNWDCIYDPKIVRLLKHTFAQGHLIGSHTWSHPNISTLNADQLNLQLELVEIALKKILGVIPRYFRPPYGSYNEQNLQVLLKRGYKVINWSFDSGDSSGVSAEDTKKAYKTLSEQNPITPQISLNHETHSSTAFDVTPYAVNVLQKVGYRLVSVSECLGLGTSLSDYYQYVGKPTERDDSWTCNGTPSP